MHKRDFTTESTLKFIIAYFYIKNKHRHPEKHFY